MSRALRVEFDGAIYHIMARGVARRPSEIARRHDRAASTVSRVVRQVDSDLETLSRIDFNPSTGAADPASFAKSAVALSSVTGPFHLGLDLANQHVYWIETQRIQRADLTPTDPTSPVDFGTVTAIVGQDAPNPGYPALNGGAGLFVSWVQVLKILMLGLK